MKENKMYIIALLFLLAAGFVFSQDQAIKVTAEGNVGIGTDTPTTQLEVAGDLTVTGDVIVEGEVTATDETIVVNGDLEVTGDITAANDQLPVGTILMFDGTDWVDNVTMPGWYACTSANSTIPGLNIPNLQNQFVMGSNTSGATGGNNSVALAIANLPAHNHTINHDHPVVTSTGQSQTHNHNLNYQEGGQQDHDLNGRWDTDTQFQGNNTITTENASVDHTHNVDLPNYTGTSGTTGAGLAFDNRPAFYTVIFIKKCE